MNKLAREILILSRDTLLVNLRFMDMALGQFKMRPIDQYTLMTDGHLLLYNVKHVLECYKQEKEIIVRDYLHLIMHCVFHHMFMDPSLNRIYWDLACDISVENVISELGLKAVATNREKQQQNYLYVLKKSLNFVTAEKIYSYLRQTEPNELKIGIIRELFFVDDHEIWYMSDNEKADRFYNQLRRDAERGEADRNNRAGNDEGNNSDSTVYGEVDGSFPDRSSVMSVWKEIGEKMQIDLETFSKIQGNRAGNLMQSLKAVNREKYDYSMFLRKFATLGEVMRINDDEFDYIFYTYGLNLYEKMPLVEPLEYKEVKRIREFVIAIDTSGSVAGELVQKFLQKTYNIIKSTESFFSRINLHIIQCDAEIQEHVKITDQEEFNRYLSQMKLQGLGGTDFRPVFNKVYELIRNKEFSNLKGLIYFTDGYGTFPSRKPDYETAFVFINDEYNSPDVPPWAIKLILQRDEI